MTLVELLIVISIMVVLMAVAIPAMQPSLEGRRIREAGRAMNVYFSSARSHAKETGRPCGVVLRRFDKLPEACMVLEQAEVPPPYSGDFTDSVLQLQTWPAAGPLTVKARLRVTDPANRTCDDFSNDLLRYGDKIQINHQGPFYEIEPDSADPPDSNMDNFPVDTDGYLLFYDETTGQPTARDTDRDGWIDTHVLTLVLPASVGQAVPWPPAAWSPPLPFEIIRQPVKSQAAPLQLPFGAVIDLTASGRTVQYPPTMPAPSDPAATPYNPVYYSFAPLDGLMGYPPVLTSGYRNEILIMFSPTGAVDCVYCPYTVFPLIPGDPLKFCYGPVQVTEPIFLAIGERSRVQSPASRLAEDWLSVADTRTTTGSDEDKTWEDTATMWLVLGPQNGTISATENDVANRAGPTGYEPYPRWYTWFWTARTRAREAQSMGGR